MTGQGGYKLARSQGEADGSKDQGGVQASEAGGADRGSSCLGRAGNCKARGGSEHPSGTD